MAEVKTEYVVGIASDPAGATGEGVVRVEVLKFAPWFEMTWNRQKLTHGITAKPLGSLVVEIPIEGVSLGDVITPDQLAKLLVGLISTVLPTCRIFVDAVEDDFGINKEEDF